MSYTKQANKQHESAREAVDAGKAVDAVHAADAAEMIDAKQGQKTESKRASEPAASSVRRNTRNSDLPAALPRHTCSKHRGEEQNHASGRNAIVVKIASPYSRQ